MRAVTRAHNRCLGWMLVDVSLTAPSHVGGGREKLSKGHEPITADSIAGLKQPCFSSVSLMTEEVVDLFGELVIAEE